MRTHEKQCLGPRLSAFLRGLLAGMLVLGTLAGCGDGSDTEAPPVNVAGEWMITETDRGNCGEGTVTYSYTLSISQSGSSLTVTDEDGVTLRGTIRGNRIELRGSYPEDGGTTSVQATATATESSISGTSTWNWTDGSFSCGGTTEFTGSKAVAEAPVSDAVGQTPDTDGDAGPVDGLWLTRSQVDGRDCGDDQYVDGAAVFLQQSGQNVTALDSSGNVFEGTVAGDVVTLSGRSPEDGGITDQEISLVFSPTAASGTAVWAWTDGSQACSGTSVIEATKETAIPELEPNDDLDTAQVMWMTNGTAFLEGQVSEDGDVADFFAFTLSSPGEVEIELSHFDVASHDLDLYLLDDTGSIVAASESAASFEVVTEQLPAGLRYFVVVVAYGTRGASPYVVSMDAN